MSRAAYIPSRRLFLTQGLGGFAALMAPGLAGCSSSDDVEPGPATKPNLTSNIADIGKLGDADKNGLRLPKGFVGRIVAKQGEKPVKDSDYEWHAAPDGGATFETEDGGWIYVSNSEIPFSGGVGALKFDKQGDLVDAYSILQDSSINCAGGRMPWGVWLSCEEASKGRVFLCDPTGDKKAEELPALGVFKHEAAAYDDVNHQLYLTEDEGDGRFYRFTPDAMVDGHADLSAGKLEVAKVDSDNQVEWLEVSDPLYEEGSKPTREQVPDSTAFKGGEGIWFHEGTIYFSTKGDDRVWAYDTDQQSITVIYDAEKADDAILTGVDNLTVSCCGDVLVCEDGGDMQIVAVLPDGTLKAILQIEGHDISEITGVAFDPSGTRLYFSSQRGSDGFGITYEVSGPFHSAK